MSLIKAHSCDLIPTRKVSTGKAHIVVVLHHLLLQTQDLVHTLMKVNSSCIGHVDHKGTAHFSTSRDGVHWTARSVFVRPLC